MKGGFVPRQQPSEVVFWRHCLQAEDNGCAHLSPNSPAVREPHSSVPAPGPGGSGTRMWEGAATPPRPALARKDADL
jgi:hypothetical protein